METRVEPITVVEESGSDFRRDPDYVAAAECAYDLSGDDAAWLGRILRALRSAFDQGMGVHGIVIRLSPGGMEVSSPVFLGVRDAKAIVQANNRGSEAASFDFAATYCHARPAASWSESAGRHPDGMAWLHRLHGDHGVRDMGVLRCYSGPTFGPVLLAHAPALVRVQPRRRAALERVATHIAAGYRLRLAHRVETEAVIDPRQGKLVHAEGAGARTRRALASTRGSQGPRNRPRHTSQ